MLRRCSFLASLFTDQTRAFQAATLLKSGIAVVVTNTVRRRCSNHNTVHNLPRSSSPWSLLDGPFGGPNFNAQTVPAALVASLVQDVPFCCEERHTMQIIRILPRSKIQDGIDTLFTDLLRLYMEDLPVPDRISFEQHECDIR